MMMGDMLHKNGLAEKEGSKGIKGDGVAQHPFGSGVATCLVVGIYARASG